MEKLWGGRFSESADSFAESFGASIHFDTRLTPYDIAGSIAHASMLAKTGILPQEEAETIVKGLRTLLSRSQTSELEVSTADEDIHMNIERLLTKEIGPVAGKLHTARSRNDQVALDVHLFVRAQIVSCCKALCEINRSLLKTASANLDAIMPGYTHLQRAQPILFSHHLHAYAEMFHRDMERMMDAWKRANVSPLGASAMAGTTFPIDRKFVGDQLKFDALYGNSMDAVSDRDFVVEFVSVCVSTMTHLSRLCEELILWSSAEFGFVEMHDSLSTGSSIMPQKKNADYAELIRGKTGRALGSYVSLITTMKGLPLTYNKDMQEDKEPLFDITDTVLGSLKVAAAMVETLKVNKENMRVAAEKGFLNATDAADYLAKKGVAFRDAHEIIGTMVKDCIKRKCELASLTVEEFKRYSPKFEEDIFEAIKLETVVNRRLSLGGTASTLVAGQLKLSSEKIKNAEQWIAEREFALCDKP